MFVVVVVFVCLSPAGVRSVSELCFNLINKMAAMARGRENLPTCMSNAFHFIVAVVFVFFPFFFFFFFFCFFFFFSLLLF